MLQIRKLIFICLLLLTAAAVAYAAPYEHPFPEALQIHMETETRQTDSQSDLPVMIPVTCSETVNQTLRGTVDALYQQVMQKTGCRVDMVSTYRISGTKWAGFLLTARAVELIETDEMKYPSEDTAALYFSVQTYDMETGNALTLADVFPVNSSVWDAIAQAAQTLFDSYYPQETHNALALQQMLTPQALAQRAFLPCAGRLVVPYALDAVVPGHHQIVNLILPYPDYRPMMQPQAKLQTDNSSRPILAITLDDGPNRLFTQRALEGLAQYGASATFFCVGNSVAKQPDLVRREMDFAHTVGAHSMTHENPWEQPCDEMQAEYTQQKELFASVTGIPVILFRPPGGDLKTFVTRQIGWPLIRWNKSGSDTGPDGARDVARRVIQQAADRDIFLMHDIKEKTAQAIPIYLQALEERGYLFATVDELLYLNGVTPQPNVAYYDGFGERTYSKSQ